jgi:hypothetical protein
LRNITASKNDTVWILAQPPGSFAASPLGRGHEDKSSTAPLCPLIRGLPTQEAGGCADYHIARCFETVISQYNPPGTLCHPPGQGGRGAIIGNPSCPLFRGLDAVRRPGGCCRINTVPTERYSVVIEAVRVGTKPSHFALLVPRQVPAQPLRSLHPPPAALPCGPPALCATPLDRGDEGFIKMNRPV